MIRDIRHTDDRETVVAHGQRYDLEKVLDFAEMVLKTFVGTVTRVYRESSPEIALEGTGSWSPLVEEEYFRMRTAITLMQANRKGFDSGSFQYVIRVGPFKIGVQLLGKYGLFRRADGTLETIAGEPAEEYDPALEIVVLGRWHRGGILEADDATVAMAAMARFLGHGLAQTGPVCEAGVMPPMLFYRFLHRTFGAGEGRLRIGCTDTE